MKRFFSRAYWQDRDMEAVMGRLLRAGVLLSGLIALVGGILYLFQHQGIHPGYHVFRGEAGALLSLKGIFQGMAALRGEALIQCGVLLLIATPIARILFSVIAFLIEKDYLYLAITFLVLLIMGFSIGGGFGG
ncbi:DUF1634 domain-containing protein [Compostibacter hankyongensis]|uniref:DUF1634 domain-containing protein n=1 Tax=Compostibacter hankyongensis TaxID=1007089 RepID=A0ABP8G0S8_9BACT